MDYGQARLLIEDGDCIAVRETHGILTPFTRFFTRSPVTHAGIAIWMDGGLWMAELNGGKNHAIPVSQLSETDFDVYLPPVDDRSAIRVSTMNALRLKIGYAFGAAFVIGLFDWLRLTVFLHARKLLVCSGYCVKIYEDAGWPERSRIISPRALVAQLQIKFEVRSKPALPGFFSADNR